MSRNHDADEGALDPCGVSQSAHVFEPQLYHLNWDFNSNLQLIGRTDWNRVFKESRMS